MFKFESEKKVNRVEKVGSIGTYKNITVVYEQGMLRFLLLTDTDSNQKIVLYVKELIRLQQALEVILSSSFHNSKGEN